MLLFQVLNRCTRHDPDPDGGSLAAQFLQLLLLASLLTPTNRWIVPQPKANVWVTLAKSMGQDHIRLSSVSTTDLMSTCLVGISLKTEEFLPLLLRLKDDANNKALGRVFHSFLEHSVERKVALPVLNPLVLWRDWVP